MVGAHVGHGIGHQERLDVEAEGVDRGHQTADVGIDATDDELVPAVGADGLINSVVSTGFGYQLLMVFISLIVLYPPVAEKITAKLGNKYVIAEVEKFMKWGIPVGLFALLISSVLLTMYTT